MVLASLPFLCFFVPWLFLSDPGEHSSADQADQADRFHLCRDTQQNFDSTLQMDGNCVKSMEVHGYCILLNGKPLGAADGTAQDRARSIGQGALAGSW